MPVIGLALAPCGRAAVGEGPVSDVHVRCEVIDPEFHQTLNLMIWQEIADIDPGSNGKDTNQLLIRAVDPESGGLTGVPSTLTRGISRYDLSQASPKFANGSDGTYIAYSRRPGAGDDDGPPPAPRTVGLFQYDPDGCNLLNPGPCFADAGYISDDTGSLCIIRAIAYTSEEEELLGSELPATVSYAYRELAGASCPAFPNTEVRWAHAAGWIGETVPRTATSSRQPSGDASKRSTASCGSPRR